MLKQIQTVNDIVAFAKQLINEGTNFHCDTDFNDYINLETNEPCYSIEEADFRNELMSQCFAVCENSGIDVYEIMCDVLLNETGLDNFIPLSTSVSI